MLTAAPPGGGGARRWRRAPHDRAGGYGRPRKPAALAGPSEHIWEETVSSPPVTSDEVIRVSQEPSAGPGHS